ncbi:Sodium-dependent phosphate transporter [Chitinispirillum alkaliphilum]|nr:Sodium-dependent phosphate transporter [Chitinispirillum alkaliphilum]
MSSFTILEFFSLLCGLALFLYGMQQGEKNLRRLGGTDIKKIIDIISRNRFSAYLAGFSTTILTQSSSATTVMLVSLASAKLMTFSQSLGMILGSDLGTTITVQLFAIKFYEIAPLLIAVGFFISITTTSDKMTEYGKLILAFGFVFFGMGLMSEAVTPLRSNPSFERVLLHSFTNPWWGLIAGTLFTAIIQSSAATLAMVITLAASYEGTPWTPGLSELLPLVLGANLGTCATAFISTLKADPDGVRVAWAHFYFKLIGTIVAFPAIWILRTMPGLGHGSPAFQIAMLHTVFNIMITAIFLPMLKPFENFILKITKTSAANNKQKHQINYLHDNLLSLPNLALTQSAKEIARMSEKVCQMSDNCHSLIQKYNWRVCKSITEQDDEVDFLHENIIIFLTRISHEELNPEEATKAYKLIMVTTDIEHIGDIISKRIIELANKIRFSPQPLSTEGENDILQFLKKTTMLFKETTKAFVNDDHDTALSIFNRKHQVRADFDEYVYRHLQRLYKRKPESVQTTSIHVDLLEEIQRMNHFSFRIAAHILEIHRAE